MKRKESAERRVLACHLSRLIQPQSISQWSMYWARLNGLIRTITIDSRILQWTAGDTCKKGLKARWILNDPTLAEVMGQGGLCLAICITTMAVENQRALDKWCAKERTCQRAKQLRRHHFLHDNNCGGCINLLSKVQNHALMQNINIYICIIW